jgi:phospholipase/carboxylesterase
VADLGFIHRFEPGKSGRTLLLLHGTGGDENDLIELGRALDPEAALLSPRGKILENGAPRFFRRLAEGVFDEDDVVRRAQELSQFLKAASATYGIDPHQLTAVGYSNGANIAAAMILLGLAVYPRAILFRPMVPLSDLGSLPDLGGVQVLVSAGKFDPIARPQIVGALAGLLRQGGAEVGVQIHPSGHELTSEDVTGARGWLDERSTIGQNRL